MVCINLSDTLARHRICIVLTISSLVLSIKGCHSESLIHTVLAYVSSVKHMICICSLLNFLWLSSLSLASWVSYTLSYLYTPHLSCTHTAKPSLDRATLYSTLFTKCIVGTIPLRELWVHQMSLEIRALH